MEMLCGLVVGGGLMLAVVGLLIRVSQGATYILRLEAELENLRARAAYDASVEANVKVIVRKRFALLNAIIQSADGLVDAVGKARGDENVVAEAVRMHKSVVAGHRFEASLAQLTDDDVFAGMVADGFTGERENERR